MSQPQHPVQPYPKRPVTRVPLTTTQHIAHMLGTIFTFGLWGIVWLIRAMQGNKVWADVPNPKFGYYPHPPPAPWRYGPVPPPPVQPPQS
jgi:hypothetical protein